MEDIFFFLSKILHYLFVPYFWVFIGLVLIVFVKSSKKRKIFSIVTLIIFYVISNSFLLDEVMRLWEAPFVENKEVLTKHYDYVVVLGGMMKYYDTQQKQMGFNRNADRIMQGIKMLNKGIADTLIVSGGDGSILKTIGPEGKYIKEYLADIGLDSSRILFESESRNTYENVVFTKSMIKKNAKVLLITSGYHLRRAVACFKKQGIQVDCYAADRVSGQRKFTFDHMFIPQSTAMSNWEALIHELVGYSYL